MSQLTDARQTLLLEAIDDVRDITLDCRRLLHNKIHSTVTDLCTSTVRVKRVPNTGHVSYDHQADVEQ